MTTRRLLFAATVAAVLSAGIVTHADAQDAQTVTVPFSDPSRPGRLEVSVLTGTITVTAENRRDVLIETRQSAAGGRAGRRGETPSPTPTPQGLRRLTQNPGFTVDEENNEMKVSMGAAFNRGLDFTIRVPARTNLKLATVYNGAVSVEGVEGDLEATSLDGSVTLTNVSGSVVAHSHSGSVRATLSRVAAQKAMAFTSFSGSVDVTLPSATKANLKLRSDNGDVFTDFEIQIGPVPPRAETGDRKGGRFRLEVNNAIVGAVNGGGPEIELRTFSGSVFVRKSP